MFNEVLYFIGGLILLIVGGDWFVDGAVGVARRFHLPEILVGATIVSIGTTIPEVMVSSIAAVGGQSQTAYGNAIGSCICNTALIAAITMTFSPQVVDTHSLRLPTIFFFVAAVFYAIVSYFYGTFTRWMGIVLLTLFVLYMILSIRKSTKNKIKKIEDNKEEENDEKSSSTIKNLAFLLIGALAIAIGANLLVDNGQIIAKHLGVPESVIALTFIALGTSLPELVTAITSLIKKHSELSLGNIIGANLFNLILVSGLAITIRPFDLPTEKVLFGHNASLLLDIPLMFVVMLIMIIPTFMSKKVKRWQGVTLLILYTSFLVLQFIF